MDMKKFGSPTDTLSITWDDVKPPNNNFAFSHDVQETKYRYRALEQRGNIRLLHLLPHRDQTGPLACRLLEYPLSSTPGESPGSSQRSHLYEALSYTWGDSNSNRCISVDSCRMSVTDNLYEALLALRDRQLSRVLWVDAICIDQGNDVEKQEQIGFMADIYSMASRVVVWLGTGEGGGEVALDAISDMAVCKVAGAPFNGEVSTEAMLGLLQRPWFNRIWVLQEVAAARAILVVCGSSSIDGYAFSLVLHSDLFRSTFAIPPELQNQLRPVTYTMGRAICRPRKTTGIASHDKSSLGELVDMYHTRQATLLHDKVFALLGMSLSNPSNEIPLDYSAGWDVVFKKLMRLLFGRSVSVETQSGSQVAGIQGLGRVLGKICRVELDGQNGQQKVSVIWLKESTTEDFAPGANWILPPSANSVREGDIVCIMKGASKPTIIRFRHGLFSVIVSTVSCYASEQTREFPHFFSLLWDWERKESRQADVTSREKMAAAAILNAVGEYDRAEPLLLGFPEDSASRTQRLAANSQLALLYWKTNRREKATELFRQQIQECRGMKRPRWSFSELWGRDDFSLAISENECTTQSLQELVPLAASMNAEAVEFIINQGDQGGVAITEEVLIAAAKNGEQGPKILDILFNQERVHSDPKDLSRQAPPFAPGKAPPFAPGKAPLFTPGKAPLFTPGKSRFVVPGKGTLAPDLRFHRDIPTRTAVGSQSSSDSSSAIASKKARVCGHSSCVCQWNGIPISEAVFLTAAQNEEQGAAITQRLLARMGPSFHVTHRLLIASWENRTPEGRKVADLLHWHIQEGFLNCQWSRLCQVKWDKRREQKQIGLEVLPPPRRAWEEEHGEPDLDVVAVHGIAGDCLDTWTYHYRRPTDSEPPRCLWLNEQLLERRPRTRALTFQYYMNDSVQTSLGEIAQRLLELLESKRSHCHSRPIVMIGHNIGGLVIKEAICLLNRKGQTSYPTVGWSIRGLVFLGTPHRRPYDFEKMAATSARQSSRPLTREYCSETVAKLRSWNGPKDSDQFRQLKDDFDHFSNQYGIVTLFETGDHPGLHHEFVDYLDLRNERVLEFTGGHWEMCKLARDDKRFDTIFEALETAAQGPVLKELLPPITRRKKESQRIYPKDHPARRANLTLTLHSNP